jgi:hypothetical protein
MTIIFAFLMAARTRKNTGGHISEGNSLCGARRVLLLAALPAEANAVVCAKGVYSAGCAGPGAASLRIGRSPCGASTALSASAGNAREFCAVEYRAALSLLSLWRERVLKRL